MRDWDTYDYDIFVCFNNVDYITYEGLRLTKILVLDIKIPGLHYLWGIETVITWYKSSYIIRSMDYITYEGLRHCQTFSKFSSFLVDYITYEGLRQSTMVNLYFTILNWITLPMRDWDVIKEILVSLSLKNRITLRMRDWDYSISLVCEFLSWGLHYLWGIETFIAAKIWFWWILGLHYLWGIETYKSWFLHWLKKEDYITYEGLRLYTSLKVITIDLRITLPMRDWDPFSLSCYIPPWKDYITYEGLRLFFFAILLSSLLYGLHYLWGIETN